MVSTWHVYCLPSTILIDKSPPLSPFSSDLYHVKFALFTGNIGNVPLVLIAALCRDKSNPFGDSEKCSQDGNAYISFGQWVS